MTLNLANQQQLPAVALMLHSGTVRCLNALHKIGLDTSKMGTSTSKIPRGQDVQPKSTMIDCQQLDRLATKISEKRPNYGTIRFLHDNARPHTARITHQKLLDLEYKVMPHPPYSPYLAPRDYHLFLSLSNAMQGKTFDNPDDIDCWLNNFFAMKEEQFYAKEIKSLPDRWRKVLENDGNYFISKNVFYFVNMSIKCIVLKTARTFPTTLYKTSCTAKPLPKGLYLANVFDHFWNHYKAMTLSKNQYHINCNHTSETGQTNP